MIIQLLETTYHTHNNPAGMGLSFINPVPMGEDQSGSAQVWDAQTGQPLTDPIKQGDLSVQFSPDGRRLVATSWDGTVWGCDFVPPSARYPDWLLQLATAVCGQVLSARGVLECTNQAQALACLRQTLKERLGGDDWLILGRWLLADRTTRTISPFSQITLPQYIDNRLQDNTLDSFAEAELLAEGSPGLLEQVARARETDGAKQSPVSEPATSDNAFIEKYVHAGGYFGKQTTNTPARWKEGKNGLMAVHYYGEVKRDDQAVVLRDVSRWMSIHIPLAGGECRFSRDDGASWHRLYDVRKE